MGWWVFVCLLPFSGYLQGEPLWFFGYGLSYTTFDYSDLEIAPAVINVTRHKSIGVFFSVRNTGPRTSDEVTQVYATYTGAAQTGNRYVLFISKKSFLYFDAKSCFLYL